MRLTKSLGFVCAMAAVLGSAGIAVAQNPEKKDLVLGVGGKGLLYYLPLTLAERLGYFKEQGLNVTINDFAGGAQSLQSLVGGSVDVVAGAYEHTIRMQAKGHEDRRHCTRILHQLLRHVSDGESGIEARRCCFYSRRGQHDCGCRHAERRD